MSISVFGICKYYVGKQTTNTHADYGKAVTLILVQLQNIYIRKYNIFNDMPCYNTYSQFANLDGSDFKKFEYFDCSYKYGTYHSLTLTSAMNECRNSTFCSMVSSTDCASAKATYHLCGPDPKLRLSQPSTACTHRKRGL